MAGSATTAPTPVALQLLGRQLHPSRRQLPVHHEPCQVVPLIRNVPSSATTAVRAPPVPSVLIHPNLPPQRIAGRSLRGLPPSPPCIGSRSPKPPPTRRLRTWRRPTPPSPSCASLLPSYQQTETTPSGPTDSGGDGSSSIASSCPPPPL